MSAATRTLVLVLMLLGVGATAGNLRFWQRYAHALLAGSDTARPADATPGERLRGGDGGGLPRRTPEEAGIEDEALAAAAAWVDRHGGAVLVLRQGHLVLEHPARGEAQTVMDSGALARLLRSVATAAAIQDRLLDMPTALHAFEDTAADARGATNGWRNPWSHAARIRFGPAPVPEPLRAATHLRYSQYVANRLWVPLNASDAMLRLDPQRDAVFTDCCLRARALDWLRVAQLLLAAGQLDGETLLSQEWLARLYAAPAAAQAGAAPQPSLGLLTAGAARGPEPFATSGVYFAHGAGATRLWLVPRLQLAILRVAPAAGPADVPTDVDDTTLPNLILRGVRQDAARRDGRRDDQPDIRSLVPAHDPGGARQ